MDFKASSDVNSSEGPRGSAGKTPSPRNAHRSELRPNMTVQQDSQETNRFVRNASKSSIDYNAVSRVIAPTANNTIQNFAVPKMALLPKPVKELI